MDSEVIALDTDSVPVPDYHVRRRKYREKAWLICRNHYYEVDSTLDQVWRLCDGERTVAEIMRRCVDACGLSLGQSIVSVAFAIQMFTELKLIRMR